MGGRAFAVSGNKDGIRLNPVVNGNTYPGWPLTRAEAVALARQLLGAAGCDDQEGSTLRPLDGADRGRRFLAVGDPTPRPHNATRLPHSERVGPRPLPAAPDHRNGVGTDARPQAGELPPALALVLRQLRAAPTGMVGSADLAALEDLCRLAAVVEEVGGPARARALLDLYCLLRAPDGGADDNHAANGE